MPDYRFEVLSLADTLALLDADGPHGRPLSDLRASLRFHSTRAASWADWLVSGSDGPVRRMLRLIGPLPASERHHDADAYGLLRHSLVVARYAVEAAQRMVTVAAGDETAAMRADSTLFAAFLGGLGHDLGKIWTLVVRVPGKAHRWHPGRGPLLDYLTYAAGDPGSGGAQAASQIQVNWEMGRQGGGHRGHEALSAWVLPTIISPSQLTWLGLEGANNIVATLLHSLGARSSNGLDQWVKDADRRATREAMAHRASTKRQMPAPPVAATAVTDDATIGQISFAADFVVGFRELMGNGKQSINGFASRVFVSPSHTIVCLDEKASALALHRYLFETARAKVDAQGVSYSPAVGQFYRSGRASSYLIELARAQTVDGVPWCVASAPEDPTTSGIPDIMHYVRISSPGTNRTSALRPCIILRNDVLWPKGGLDPVAACPTAVTESVVPGAEGGYCSLVVSLFRRDKHTASCDPTEFEFTTETPSPTTDAITAKRISLVDSGLSSLGLAIDLWRTLDRIVPVADQPTTAVAKSWRQLGAQIADLPTEPAPAERDGRLLQAILAAACDRLVEVPVPTPGTSSGDTVAAIDEVARQVVPRIRRATQLGPADPPSPLGRIDTDAGRLGLLWPQGVALLAAAFRVPFVAEDRVLVALAGWSGAIPTEDGRLLHPDPLVPDRLLLVLPLDSLVANDDGSSVPPDLALSPCRLGADATADNGMAEALYYQPNSI